MLRIDSIWFQVIDELQIPQQLGYQWWTKIKKNYTDGSRMYHNMDTCLKNKFKIYYDVIENKIDESERLAFILAMVFQHYEYDTCVYGDCVERNMESVKVFFKEAGIDESKKEMMKSVIDLLGAGREGGCCDLDTPNDTPAEYFQDLELSPLGLPPDEYIEYSKNVMKEYILFMPSHLYMTLRFKVLQTLLMIPRIYSTDAFYEKFEDIARQNIRGELERTVAKANANSDN